MITAIFAPGALAQPGQSQKLFQAPVTIQENTPDGNSRTHPTPRPESNSEQGSSLLQVPSAESDLPVHAPLEEHGGDDFLNVTQAGQAPDDSSSDHNMGNNVSAPTLDEQIRLIDTEILLLKAELAQKNGQWAQVEQYVTQLDDMNVQSFSDNMQQRIEQLKTSLKAHANQPSENLNVSSDLVFKADYRKPVILLPLSGPYETIGRKILSGLMPALESYAPVVIDSEIYDSMLELWELVRLYNPSLIIGPLDKKKAQQFSALNIEVPTLFLNDVDDPTPYQAVFSLGRTMQVTALKNILYRAKEGSVLVLSDDSSSSQKLLTNFRQAWSEWNSPADNANKEVAAFRYPNDAYLNNNENSVSEAESFFDDENNVNNAQSTNDAILPGEATSPVQYARHLVVLDVKHALDKTLAEGLNVESSEGRKYWLQKQVRTPLYYEPRARNDISTVISFLPYDQAMQVTPLMNFYHLGNAQHIWLPSQLPRKLTFEKSLPFWQRTLTLLPSYYANPLLDSRQNVIDNTTDDSENDETGIFYAFGEVAAKVVNRLAVGNREPFDSPLGEVRFWKQRHAYLMPDNYRLGNDRIIALKK